MDSIPQEHLLNAAILDLQHRVRNLQGALSNRDAELQAAVEVVKVVPSAEYLRELVKWCDLIDKFASMVDESYTLPRDEIQRDLMALANVIEQYHARRG